MNIRDLNYLVALAEERNFRRAAERCFVSQPTLSTQIKKLEDELNVALFERLPRKVLLTDAGEAVVERARAILQETEDIRQIAKRSVNPETGRLRLGIFPTLAPYLLPHVIPAITARFPELELLLYEHRTEEILEELAQGRLDVGVLAQPVHAPGLAYAPLFDEAFAVALPKQHPLAAKTVLNSEDLAGHDLLLLEDGHCLRDQALEVCHRAGAGEHLGFRATSLETLRQMVAANVGITLLPMLAVNPPVASNPAIALRAFEHGQRPHRSLAMFWRKSSAIGDFMQQLASCFQSLDKKLLEELP
jgi:LysR family hydrogen peroxide-inducible transcriptional activator